MKENSNRQKHIEIGVNNISSISSKEASLFIERLRNVLRTAQTPLQLKQVRFGADALKKLFQSHQVAIELVNDVAEVQIMASRSLGEYLLKMEKNPGVKMSGSSTLAPPENIPTLSDLGIAKTTAHRLQTLAKVPRMMFERFIQELREREDGEALTQAAVHRLAKRYITEQEQPIPSFKTHEKNDEVLKGAIPSNTSEEDLFETRQVLDFLSIEKSTLSKWMDRGVLRPIAKVERERNHRLYQTFIFYRSDVARIALKNPPQQSSYLTPEEIENLIQKPPEYQKGVLEGYFNSGLNVENERVRNDENTATKVLFDEGVEFGKELAQRMI